MDTFNITDPSYQNRQKPKQRSNRRLYSMSTGRTSKALYNNNLSKDRKDYSFDSLTGKIKSAERRLLREEANSMIEEENERLKDPNYHAHEEENDEGENMWNSPVDFENYLRKIKGTQRERLTKYDEIANFGRKELKYDSTFDGMNSSLQRSRAEEVFDSPKILVDVVNGDYTLEEVIGEIPKHEEPNTTLLIHQFDNVFKKNIQKIKKLLKADSGSQYFKNLDLNKIEQMTPLSMQTDILNASTTAADMIAGMRLEQNEALSAMDALNNAEILMAAEIKLKKVYCAAMRRANMPLDQFGLDETLDYTIDDILELNAPVEKESSQFEYSMKYDVSYIPNTDSDVYNPIEIISYIGITRPSACDAAASAK